MDTYTSGKLEKSLLGVLKGHNGEVTSIVTGNNTEGFDSKLLISGSRDKKVIIWKLNPNEEEVSKGQSFGEPLIALTGHNHFVSDLALTKDNNHLFSSSWDKTLRLWNIKTGKCLETFVGKSSEICSVTISNDTRKIYSSGMESQISLWNTKGKMMEVSMNQNHQDWVSKVRYSPSSKNDYLATAGWDGKLKLWIGNFQTKCSFVAHEGPINALAIALNGMFIATGGLDQFVKIWNIKSLREPYQVIKCSSNINDIVFNPQMKIFAVASNKDVSVYSLDSNIKDPNFEIALEKGQGKFSSLAWSADGKYLFCGCGNGNIVVYKIELG